MAKNIFKAAKTVQRANPKLSWQQAIQKAAAQQKKPAAKKRKVGAYKVIERNEKKSTPAKKVVRVNRSKTGTFKGYSKVGSVSGNALQEISRQLSRKQQLTNQKDALKAIRPSTPAVKKEINKISVEIFGINKYIATLKRSI